MKPATSHNEPARLAALQRYRPSDGSTDPAFDDLTLLAAQLCATPVAFICFPEESRLVFTSMRGLTDKTAPRVGSFCAQTIQAPGLMIVEDARQDPRFADNPLVRGKSPIRFYAGAPLLTPDGHAIGTLAVMDRAPRQLDDSQREGLLALARQAITQLELRRHARELEQAAAIHRGVEQTLEAERNLLRSLVDNLPDFIYVKDAASRYILDNAAHRKFLGVTTMDQVVGKSVFDFFPKPLAQRYFADDQRIIGSGQPLLNREEPIVDPQGASRWVSTTKVPLRDRDGRVIGLVAIGRDVTERKRNQAALAEKHNLLRTLIDNLPDFIFVKDTRGRFILNNRAHLAVLGAKSQEEVIGRSDADFFPAEMAQRYLDAERRVLEAGEPLLDHEEPYTDTAGTARWLSTSKVPLRDPAGQVIGLVGMSRDITDRKWAEEQVARYARDLQESNQQMHEDLRIAAEIQRAFLPEHYPSFPPTVSEEQSALRFWSRYQPTGTVGGDFFDVLRLSDTRAGVFICDVMGHGVRSALVTAMVRALVEELMPLSHDPARFLTGMNHRLISILRQTRMPMFVSAFYLIADISKGEMLYANAGHPRPLHLRRSSRTVEPLRFEQAPAGPALGVFEDAVYHANTAALEDNDLIVLYTDGLYEVAAPDDEEYGQERLVASVRKRLALPPARLFDEIFEEIKTFAVNRQFSDDVCLLGMEVAHLSGRGANGGGG
jgi:sigma-B regulation protein RsbU (phosphoserine phosphatase)